MQSSTSVTDAKQSVGVRRAVTCRTRQGRRAERRHSRSRQQGCQRTRTRRSRRGPLHTATGVECCRRSASTSSQMPSASASDSQVPTVILPRASSWSPSRCRSPAGLPSPPSDAALVADVSVTVAVSFRDVSTSALVDLARTVAHAARVIARQRMASTSSQMPSASASAVAKAPPHTPRASSWLPSQSQSPAGMSEHPHCTSPDHCTHRTRHSCLRSPSTSSQMPSTSASAVHVTATHAQGVVAGCRHSRSRQ